MLAISCGQLRVFQLEECSSGNGRAAAIAFAKEGANVAIVNLSVHQNAVESKSFECGRIGNA